MNQTVTLAPPQIGANGVPITKGEREKNAFYRLLPTLLATHLGKFVAIHEEKVVDAGDEKLAVALRVLNKVGNVDIFVGLVAEEPPSVARSGVRRESPGGKV